MKIQSLTLLVLLWMSDSISAVIIWTCPRLHLPDTVSCMCDLPHTLRCSGTCSRHPETLTVLLSSLAMLSEANSVTVLDLALRNITSIPDRVFQGGHLHGVIVSAHGPLQLSPGSFHGLEETLLALGLPSNNLTSVPVGAIRTLTLLQRLDLSNNQITTISRDHLAFFAHLEELDLGYNHVSRIEPGSFEINRNLKRLILDGNALNQPSLWTKAATTGLEALEILYLQHNGLKGNVTRESLPGLPSLTKLNVAFNGLEAMHSGAFAELRRLQFLDASHNALTSIEEGAFRGLKNLMKLDLSHNYLNHLREKAFFGLTSLAYLNLNDNYLDTISDNLFHQLRSIRFINVKDNEIAHIHASAFTVTQQLESLDLEDNNLQCDCKMKGFASWLKTKAPFQVEKKRLITCDSPAARSHQAVIDVQPHEFVCSDDAPSETLSVMKDDERGRFDSVSESGLHLSDYEYESDDGKVTLTWLVDRDVQPYRCDAIFVFEESDDVRRTQRKRDVHCDSATEANPNRLRVQLGDVTLDAATTYRFCLVLFSSTTLVPGCSEPLRLQSGSAGAELVSETIQPKRTVTETTELMPIVRVDQSAASASVTVSWTFPPVATAPSESCTLNVSFRVDGRSMMDRQADCSSRVVNFTDVVPPKRYSVCVTVFDPGRSSHRTSTHCVDVEPSESPVTSATVVATVVGTVLVSVAIVLLVGIFFLARRMFWPATKSANVLSVCRSGAQYSVLYHQPDEGPRIAPSRSDQQWTQV